MSNRSSNSTATPETATVTAAATPNTTGLLALCCSVCDSPIATAADLLPKQVPRLESASYPYKLDLLIGTETESPTSNDGINFGGDGDSVSGGECWVYSATNPDQTRFDVARFGQGACQRVHVHGEPTTAHTFFPPHPWRMASCPRCWVHLGWSFGTGREESAVDTGSDVNDAVDGGDQGDSFLGLILTNLRERRVDVTDLDAVVGLVEVITSRLREVEEAMEAMAGGDIEEVVDDRGLDGAENDVDVLLNMARARRDEDGSYTIEEEEDEVGEVIEEDCDTLSLPPPSPPT